MCKRLIAFIKSLEPLLPLAEEGRYRSSYYYEDMRQIRIMLTIVVVVSGMWFFKEISLYSYNPALIALQIMRIFYICVALLFLLHQHKRKDAKINRALFLLFAIPFIIQQSLIFITRPPSYSFSSFMTMLIVLLIYFTFPFSLPLRSALALALSLSDVFTVIVFKEYEKGGKITVIVTYLVLNMICLSYSAANNTTRRKKFKQLIEKEILLKEVHHRTKNNIAAVAAMLKMQSEQSSDPAAARILHDARTLVESMRIIYEKLLLDNKYATLSVKQYLEELCTAVLQIFPEAKKVLLNLSIEEFDLEVKRMFALGTIVNELITNSMKYAFENTVNAAITLALSKKGGVVTLNYSDNGAGLADEFSFAGSAGFGLMLIRMMTEQLGGTLKFRGKDGFACEIGFAC